MRTLVSLRVAAALVVAAMFTAPLGAITRGPDAGGYTATDATVYSFVDVSGAGGASVLSGSDDAAAALTLPFPFVFYGQSYSLVCVSSNGALYFITAAASCANINDIGNVDLALTTPNDWPAMFPFWTDLTFQAPGAGSIFYQTVGAPGNRRFIIQWNNALPIDSSKPVTFEIVLAEGTNTAVFQYKTVVLGAGNPASGGGQATVGIRNSGGGGDAIEWSFNAAVLQDSSAVVFSTPLAPTLTVPDTTVVYSGSPQGVPASLAGINGEALGPLTITYNGSPTVPTNAGSYAVAASFAGNGTYTAVNAMATLTINPATPSVTVEAPVATYDGNAHGATATAVGAAGEPLSSVTIAYNGDASAPSNAGSYSVIASIAGSTNYLPASAGATLVINPATPSVTVNSATATYDANPHSVVATATGVNNVLLSPVTMTYNGSASAPSNAGSYSVVASIAASGNYLTATGNGTLTINPATPTISVTSATVTYDGNPHSVVATATGVNSVPLSPVTVTYNGSATTPSNAGGYTVVASIAANGNYEAAIGTGTLTIDKATPAITWANPGDIVQGTALGSAQLNAAANVPGSFVYDPLAGTVLPLGSNQTLSTTFTPNNGANYTTATATAHINVVTAAGQSGRFRGAGGIDTTAAQTRFDFEVRANAPTNRGQIKVRTRPNTPRDRDGDDDRDDRHGPWNRFVSTSIAVAMATNAPGVSPGGRPASGIDTLAFSGVGTWNGAPNYRFTATAVDAGEPGRGRDLFSVRITAPNGNVVLNVSGTITSGNIQSLPTR